MTPFGTDDDHRVVLKSISGGVDCEHNYINAAYVDVSFLKIFKQLHICKQVKINTSFSVPLNLTLRGILKRGTTLPHKVSYIGLGSSYLVYEWISI